MLSPEQIALLQQWHAAKAAVAHWTAVERELRDKFVAMTFPGGVDGTYDADAGNGYGVKLVQSTRYEVLDVVPMRQLVNQFCAFGETSETGGKLLKWKPSLSVSAYKALPEWGTKLMQPYVTTKPNAPQLTLITPEK